MPTTSSTPSPNDELLSILLINLRNAAATFGEGTPPYENIRTVVEEHLQMMKAQGLKTDVTNARLPPAPSKAAGDADEQKAPQAGTMFANLAFRPK